MSVSALVVIDYAFHKTLNTHKGFLTKKDTFEIPICLYLCYSIGSITSAFSLKNLGTKITGGIIKVVAVVNMVLNFLITDNLFIYQARGV